jgi:hypothetical protein
MAGGLARVAAYIGEDVRCEEWDWTELVALGQDNISM